jgi:glycosyltransferase 2 family protein
MLIQKSISWIKQIVSTRYFKPAIGLAIASLSLYLAVREVDFFEFKLVLENVVWVYIGLALISTFFIILARVVRWKLLLGIAGKDITHTKTFMALLAGQALNLIYPARIGDLSRAFFLGKTGQGRAYILGTVVLEKLFDAITYMLIFFLLFTLLPLPAWLSSSGYTFAILTLVSASVLFMIAYRVEWISGLFQRFSIRFPNLLAARISTWLSSSLDSLFILRNKRHLLKLSFWSMIIWVIPIFTNHLTLLALQIRLPLTASILTMLVLQASVAIPSVPGRIGLFEYLCVLSLSLFGVQESQAFAYGVLLHVLALLPSTVAGLIFLWVLGFNRGSELGPVQNLEVKDFRVRDS